MNCRERHEDMIDQRSYTHNLKQIETNSDLSSVGKALHRYRRGHGVESRSGLEFFSGFNLTTASVSYEYNCDQSCLSVQIYDLSYVNLHSSPSKGILRARNLTSSQMA